MPRFSALRRAGIAIWHECKDLDLAVWLARLDQVEILRRTRARALRQLFAEQGIGVAAHQVEVFILERDSDRYLGRLCLFNACPKGRRECRVPGCGEHLFLRQHEGFRFDRGALSPEGSVTLFDRTTATRRYATDLSVVEVPGSS